MPRPLPDARHQAVPATAKLLAVLVFLVVFAAIAGAAELVVPGAWRYAEFWGIPVVAVYWPLAFRVLRRIHGPERVAADRRATATREAKYRRWLLRYLAPVVALFFAYFGGVDAGPAWLAWHGAGRPGWAVAEYQECGKTCSWSGSFRSDDGAVVRADVWIWDPPASARVGDRVRAVDTADRTAVFEASGDGARTQWWLSMAFFVAGTLFLAWWLGWVTGVWRLLRRDGEDLL